MFIIIGASAQELPDVKALCERAGDRPGVCCAGCVCLASVPVTDWVPHSSS